MLTPFRKDTRFWLHGVEYVVKASIDDNVHLESEVTGERRAEKLFNLLTAYVHGDLKTSSDLRHAKKSALGGRTSSRMDLLSPKAQDASRTVIDYITKLLNKGAFESGKANLIKLVARISEERGDPWPPHVSTIYKWRRTYRAAGDDVGALLKRFNLRGGRGKTRFDPLLEEIIDNAIAAVFKRQKTCEADSVLEELKPELARLNKERGDSSPPQPELKPPSKRTVHRRMRLLPAYDVAAAKYGLEIANRMFAFIGSSRSVSRILEIVEIDHSPIDLFVIRNDGKTVGRPTVTVVLDRRSRCVLGLHLSLAGHGTRAVFAALQHAFLPKLYLKTTKKDWAVDWDCFGWPEMVLMDNGTEFHALAVQDGLIDVNVTTEFAKSKEPNDKPFVERFLRTLNYCLIHRLPGTTFAKYYKRIGRKPEAEACLTLEELDRIIHLWICNRYHTHRHLGLRGRTPLDVWKEGAAAHPPQLKLNAADLDISFSEPCEKPLWKYGVEINTFRYNSPRLSELRKRLPADTKVSIRWPSGDVGHIYVWHPIDREYFAVPNLRPAYAGLTVEQAKLVDQARLAEDASSYASVADPHEAIKAIVERAMASMKLQDRKNGARAANMTSDDHRRESSKEPKKSMIGVAPLEPISSSPEMKIPDVLVDSDWTSGEAPDGNQ